MADIIISSLRVVAALLLVGLNGFFVASEFAFVRIRESTVKELAEEGSFGSSILLEVMDELDDYLAVTQLGITVASLGLGWLGEPAIAALIEEFLGSYIPAGVLHLLSFAIGFSIITFLHVVFGELAPKTLSIQRTEKICLLVAAPMKFFRILFTPGIIVFNGAANRFTMIFGVEPASETEEIYSEPELRNVLSQSGRQGQVDKEEVKMIEKIFELDDMKIKEIMVPRPDVATMNRSDTVEQIREKTADKRHTRYPVVEDGGDEVIGFIDIKDVFQLDATYDPDAVAVEDVMEDIVIIPESATVSKALKELKHNQVQMAAVVDEWGVFEGIITIEDAVEVVVGDIRDKYDTDDDVPSIDETDEGYLSDGSISLSLANERIGTEFDENDIDTIAGLILSETGEVPDEGNKILHSGYELEVIEKENNRIQKVRISKEDTSNHSG